MQLTSQQETAISMIALFAHDPAQQIFYLSGFAGTGKTTIIKEAVAKLDLKRVVYGAYTGKAASVLRRKGITDATTLHRLLYRSMPVIDPATGQAKVINGKKQFVHTLDPNGAAGSAELVVLDECSMIPQWMYNDLLSVAKKILFVGDHGQLPPVKAISPLLTMTPHFTLTQIHRQAQLSPILQFATMARQSRFIPFCDKGDARKITKSDWLTNLDFSEDQIICGYHRNRIAINEVYRTHYGQGQLPTDGAKIVCKENHRGSGVLNGEIYHVVGDPVPAGEGCILADLDDGDEIFPNVLIATDLFLEVTKPHGLRAPSFDWGYAVTVHVAQGSEWPDVVVLDDWRVPDSRARWLYTGLTRSSEKLTIVDWR